MDANPAPTSTTPSLSSPPDPDRPVRILVQTQTHLVPGTKATDFGQRYDAMVSLICQLAWQREFDEFRERVWTYRLHFALDNVECWFLVDHHGPGEVPPEDPEVVWYKWTGSEFVLKNDPLPRKVRREMRHYPFERVATHILTRERPLQQPRKPRVYKSREEEIHVKRYMLLDTLRSNLWLTDELRQFAKDFPQAAEWVKARVPPETWARLESPDEVWVPLELGGEGQGGGGGSEGVESPDEVWVPLELGEGQGGGGGVGGS